MTSVRPAVAGPRARRRLEPLGRRRLVLVFPVYWMVLTAFKPGNDILTYTPRFLPSRRTLENFRDALTPPYFWSSVGNSLIVTLATVAISLVRGVRSPRSPSPGCASAAGRLSWSLVIFVQMVPLAAMVIPLYLLLNDVGQTDMLTGVIITYLAFVLPFTVWTLRGFIAGMPIELEEAAHGRRLHPAAGVPAGRLPAGRPGPGRHQRLRLHPGLERVLLAYVMLTTPEKQTLTVWLASFTTQKGTEWGPLMAGSTMTALPSSSSS